MKNIKNRVQLIGHVGNDPEIKHFEGDKLFARLSLATSETHKNKDGEKVTETQWHNLVAFGQPAKVIEQFVTKGKEIAIEGKLTSRNYEDKDGVKRYITEVLVNEILLMGAKKK